MANRTDNSPFRKRVLLPLWVIRDIFMVIQIAVLGVAIAAVSYASSSGDWKNLKEYKDAGVVIGTVIAILAVNMVIVMFCLALDLACIIKRYRHTLSTRFFLITNIVQTLIWTVLFVLSAIGARGSGILSIIISVLIYLTFLGLLTYSIIVYVKEKKQGRSVEGTKMMEYHNVNNDPAVTGGHNTAYGGNPAYGSAPGQNTYGQHYDAPVNTGYNGGAPASNLAPNHNTAYGGAPSPTPSPGPNSNNNSTAYGAPPATAYNGAPNVAGQYNPNAPNHA